jgi:hypothetical protein
MSPSPSLPKVNNTCPASNSSLLISGRHKPYPAIPLSRAFRSVTGLDYLRVVEIGGEDSIVDAQSRIQALTGERFSEIDVSKSFWPQKWKKRKGEEKDPFVYAFRVRG